MRSRHYPTEEYLRSIMKWIQGHGVADAQLPVTNRVSSDDMLPIIQGNRNKIINVTAFASYVGNIISGNTAASLAIEDGELVLYSKLGVSMGSVSLKDYIDTLETGTTYTAGTGIVIDGEAISIDDSYVSSLISSDSTVETAIRSLFAASSGLSYNSSSGTYSINEEWLSDYIDNNVSTTTYSAGSGLSLSGTTFSLDYSSLLAYINASLIGEGLVSEDDKISVDEDYLNEYIATYINENGTDYTLPAATTSTLGGVKIGDGVTIASDGTVSVKDINLHLEANSGNEDLTIGAGDDFSLYFFSSESIDTTLTSGDMYQVEFAVNETWLGKWLSNKGYTTSSSSSSSSGSITLSLEANSGSEDITLTSGDEFYLYFYGDNGVDTTLTTGDLNQVQFGINETWLDKHIASYINENGTDYTLPVATTSTLGGVKIGGGIEVSDDGTVSVDVAWLANNIVVGDGLAWIDGDLELQYGEGITVTAEDGITVDTSYLNDYIAAYINENGTDYTLPAATSNTLGGVIIGDGLNISDDGTVSVNSSWVASYVAINLAGAGLAATDDNLITIDTTWLTDWLSDQGYDTGSSESVGYTAGSGLSLSGTTFSLDTDYLDEYIATYINENGTDYTLPAATTSTLGGVKVGSYLTIDEDGTLDMLDIDDFYTKYLSQDPSVFVAWCSNVLGNETTYSYNTSLVYDEDTDAYEIGTLVEPGSTWREELDNPISISTVFLTHQFILEDDDGNQIQAKMTPKTQPHYYLHEGDGVNVVIEEDTSVTWSINTSWMSENYASASDKRLKTDIKDFNALEIIDKLSPVSFKWNEKAHKISENYNTENTNYGLIAQDSDGVIDGFVDKGSKEDDMWAVKYQKLVPILLKAIQELEVKNKNLEERLNTLENNH